MWNAAGELQDTLAVIPDSSLRRCVRRGRRRLPGPRRVRPRHDGFGAQRRAHGAEGRGVRLARQDVRDPRPTAPCASSNRAGECVHVARGRGGRHLARLPGEGRAGPRLGAPRGAARAALTGAHVVFWLDETRAHDAQIIAKVREYLRRARHRRASPSRSWRPPTRARTRSSASAAARTPSRSPATCCATTSPTCSRSWSSAPAPRCSRSSR